MLIGSSRGSGGEGKNALQIGLIGLAACCVIVLWGWFVAVSGGGSKPRPAITFFALPFTAGSPSVLAGYEHALRLMEADRAGEAATLLTELKGRPLEAGAPDAPDDRTSSALLIRLGMVQCYQARALCRRGDAPAARAWVRSARSLAAAVLFAPEPTLDKIRTAHAIDSAAGRTAVAVEKSACSSAAVAVPVAQREARLRAFFQNTLWPQMKDARRLRDAATQDAALSAPPGGAQAQARRRAARERDAWDADLAASLREQYVAARAALLPDDARKV